MEVWVVAPKATIVPSGRCTSGPISGTIPSPPLFGSVTMVLPALLHVLLVGLNVSELVPSSQSTVRTVPCGVRAKPSSENPSAFPEPLVVQVKVLALNSTCSLDGCPPWPIMNIPLGRTMPGESPIVRHPLGGFTAVHWLATGSYMSPRLVSTPCRLLYSPPS